MCVCVGEKGEGGLVDEEKKAVDVTVICWCMHLANKFTLTLKKRIGSLLRACGALPRDIAGTPPLTEK